MGQALSEIAGVVAAIAIGLASLWWLWQGLVGTWFLLKHLFRRHPWLNGIGIVILILIFGWNVLPILLAVAIGLGWFTRALARHIWHRAI